MLLLCTVFVVDDSITQGIVIGQTFWFYKTLPAVALATFCSYLINKNPIGFSIVDGLFLLFMISGIVITWFPARELTPITQTLFNVLILYFLIKIQLSQVHNSSVILIVCFLLSGFIEAVWGLRQLYGFTHSQHSLFKTTGSFYNPGPYAGYLAMIAPMALHFFLRGNNALNGKITRNAILAIAATSFISIVIILPSTASRASWLSAIAGCLAVMIFNNRQLINLFATVKRKKIAFISFIGLMALTVAFYSLYVFKKDSADGRFLIWKNTIEQIKDNPFGVGIGFYAGSYGKYQAEYFENKNGTEQEEMIAGVPQYAFNEYLQICAEWGIFPFLLFLTILALSISSAIKNKKIAPLGGLISLLVFAGMSYPFSLMPFVISLIVLIAICNSSEDYESINKPIARVPVFLFYISAFCSTVYIAAQQKEIYESYQAWTKSRYLYNTKSYETAEKSYSEEYEALKHNVEYLFEYGHILSNIKDYRTSNLILGRAKERSCDPMIYNILGKNHQALGEYDQAIEHYLFAMNLVPHRLYPSYLLTRLYIEINDLEKAKESVQNLLDTNIKITSPATEQMRNDMKNVLDSLEKTTSRSTTNDFVDGCENCF
ncbi:O-antigen ligase family protein [Albibacterium indicum]|uniref:O-antigen ligase family protein n=1 Tax=Albibacterium indicum TaxID=2292082 RepID=UPI0013005996|nr:O-antigen ligase family protein [Pedobacter indicus]